MRLTKFGHSCVRIGDLVIDPGSFTQPDAVEGAAGILITHEHPDHWTAPNLRGAEAPIFTIAAVRDAILAADPGLAERITVVAPGESFEAAGLPVTAENERHAMIHPEFPRVANSGYLIQADGQWIFHPGDALEAPSRPVDVLCLPASAPWAAAYELIDYGRRVAAPVNLAIHDRIYSEAGAGVFDKHVDHFFPAEGLQFRRVADGEDL